MKWWIKFNWHCEIFTWIKTIKSQWVSNHKRESQTYFFSLTWQLDSRSFVSSRTFCSFLLLVLIPTNHFFHALPLSSIAPLRFQIPRSNLYSRHRYLVFWTIGGPECREYRCLIGRQLFQETARTNSWQEYYRENLVHEFNTFVEMHLHLHHVLWSHCLGWMGMRMEMEIMEMEKWWWPRSIWKKSKGIVSHQWI